MSDALISRNKMKNILAKAHDLICNNLDPEPLLGIMLGESALTFDEVILIRSNVVTSGKAKELVKIMITSKPATSYDVFMDGLLRMELPRKDIYDAIVPIEKEFDYTRPGVDAAPLAGNSDGAQQLSQDDIFTITHKTELTKEKMDTLLIALRVRQDQISNGRQIANTPDYKLQTYHILIGEWLQDKASAATRQVVIKALKEIGANKAARILQKEWGIDQ